jgi:hypothetical protein
MRAQRLAKIIKFGYLVFKEGVGVPSWLVPAHSMVELAGDLGDNGVLNLGRPLDIGAGFNNKVESAAGPLAMTAEDWQSAVAMYPYRQVVGPMMETLLEVTSKITAAMDRIRLSVDTRVIARGIAVLAYAPFVETGKPVLDEAGNLLTVDSHEPAEILKSYAQAVLDGDVSKVNAINDCITRHQAWVEWADMLHHQSKIFKHHPKVIAVTPPFSPELSGVLVTMLKVREAK